MEVSEVKESMKKDPEGFANLMLNSTTMIHPHTKKEMVWVATISMAQDNQFYFWPSEKKKQHFPRCDGLPTSGEFT